MTMPKNQWVCCRCHGQLKAGTSSAIRSSLWRSQARSFHRSRSLRDNYSGETQAQPLGDFYTDLLAKPIPKVSRATSSLPAFVQSGDETKEERAKKLFGNIRGSGYERHTFDKPDETWHTINGVPIPPRPPEPDNCCMSGCVHCVWDDYRDDIEGWAARVHEAQAKSMEQSATNTPKIQMPRPEVSQASGSMDDDGGGSESLWTTSSGEDEGEALFGGIPIGIREFMATEKRIRERKRAKEGRR
jgi:Oxidoreductase-like protein, N-terminal